MLSFDTNILVYASDPGAGLRHTTAVNLLATAASGDAALTEQSLIEFLNVARRKQKRPFNEAAELVRTWLTNFRLLTTPTTIVEDTLSLLRFHRLEVWDAHMLAICASYGCDFLFSEDMTDGGRYGEVEVLNPFNPSNARRVAELLLP